ncbi:hypothetical protein ACFQ36_08975 [Arthrobacter sp. GCM10027362]|uniref:hypothetical protein n=1 Tax=Arthrobacter sp. GCM10027362 TaxID=3273379 RepID=UPI003634B3A6
MSFDAGFDEDSGPAPGKERGRTSWPARAAVVLLLLVLVVAAGAILSAIVPVWWATTIGTQVGGDLSASIVVGMFYGFTFTLLPLLVAWQARFKRVSWPWKVGILVVAVLLAAPNLLTAGIALGTSNSAHQAQRILGTEATWFIPWTLYSAIAAALVFVAIVVLWTMWRRRGRALRTMQAGRDRSRPVAESGPDARGSPPDSPGPRRGTP